MTTTNQTTTSAPKTTKVSAKAKPVVVTSRKRVMFTDDMVITILAEGNPKSRTAAVRYAFYKTGQKVSEYKKLVRNENLALRDLGWDTKQGWIVVTAADKAPKAKAPKAKKAKEPAAAPADEPKDEAAEVAANASE